MSAKGRGREVRDFEWYPTPAWCVHRLLERIGARLGSVDAFLEPCAGDGAIVRAVDEWLAGDGAAFDNRCAWYCNDIQDVAKIFDGGSARVSKVDQCDGPDWLRAHRNGLPIPALASITNPPFSKALEFMAESVVTCTISAYLVRLNIVGASDDRVEWLRAHKPEVFVLPDRPSFDGIGNDSGAYAWLVFDDRIPSSSFDILDRTPLSVRKEAEAEARRLLEGRTELAAAMQGSLFS